MFTDRAVLLLAVGQTLAWAALYYVFPALLLHWELDLGWSKADLTGAITLAVLITALFSPLAGRIIDRGHGAALMAGSAALGGLALALLSAMTALWQFYALWACIGLAMSGCLYEPCFVLLTRARGGAAKRGIIFITLLAGLASTISFPSAHMLVAGVGWRLTVMLFGGVAIGAVAPLLWLGARLLEAERDPVRPETADDHPAPRSFLRRPAFWLLAVSFFAIATVHGATLQHLLPYLDEIGLPADLAVLTASCIGPMQIAGRLAMMASERVTSHHGIAVAAFAMLGGAVILLLASARLPLLLPAFVLLFGGAYGTVSILRPLLTRDILGARNFGAKSGAIALPYLVGAATAPFLGALIWGIGGYGAMLGLLTLVAALGCGCYLAAHRLSARETR